MAWPFSERVAEASWLDRVRGWIQEALPSVVIDRVEQTRIRPWSTQVQVESADGRWWFKATCASQRFEPALQRELAELAPGAVDHPVSIESDEGWLLTVDRGSTWLDAGVATLEQWQDLVAEAARLQQRLAGHGVTLCTLGVPDCSPSTVVDRFDRLLDVYGELPIGHPAHLPRELRTQLRAARSRLVDAAAVLDASRLPVTWNHGDLHPANVFATDDGLRLFDLGDSQWAHASEILAVPFGWISERSDLPWEPIVEAYAAEWDVPASLLADDWAASGLTHGVNRSLTWWACLAEATAQEWSTWGDAPLHHLSRVLER